MTIDGKNCGRRSNKRIPCACTIGNEKWDLERMQKILGLFSGFLLTFWGNGRSVLLHACVWLMFSIYIFMRLGIISSVVYDYMTSLFYRVCLYQTPTWPSRAFPSRSICDLAHAVSGNGGYRSTMESFARRRMSLPRATNEGISSPRRRLCRRRCASVSDTAMRSSRNSSWSLACSCKVSYLCSNAAMGEASGSRTRR
jgi:hypothetical protein